MKNSEQVLCSLALDLSGLDYSPDLKQNKGMASHCYSCQSCNPRGQMLRMMFCQKKAQLV